jgi:hypothetical protein
MKQINKERKNTKYKDEAVIACLFSFFLLMLMTFAIAIPTGPTSINIYSNSTKATTGGIALNIEGGYITKVNISASTQNPHWKALVGEISGSFTLDDASGSTIYNWSAGSANGEIYATRQSGAITWTTITCADASEVAAEDNALHHFAKSDNISSTFTAGGNSGTYVVASNPVITPTQCFALNTYVNNNTQSADFEQIILHDTTNIIFATVIETDETGYDGGIYDFQMLLAENSSSTATGIITYYVYVELD